MEGIYIFLNIASDYSRCIRVFELLVYLRAGARIAVLLKVLYTRNFLLLRLPSCLLAAAVYRVSVEFLFRPSQDFKGGRVDINK